MRPIYLTAAELATVAYAIDQARRIAAERQLTPTELDAELLMAWNALEAAVTRAGRGPLIIKK